jgi:hypothetical protein
VCPSLWHSSFSTARARDLFDLFLRSRPAVRDDGACRSSDIAIDKLIDIVRSNKLSPKELFAKLDTDGSGFVGAQLSLLATSQRTLSCG